MNREISFMTFMTISGLVTGLAISAILMAIAAPNIINAVLTIPEKESFEALGRTADFISSNMFFIVYVPTLILSLISTLLFLLVLNPRIRLANLRSINSKLKLACVLIAWLCIPVLAASIEYLLGIVPQRPFLSLMVGGNNTGFPIYAFIEASVIGGLTWFVVGEKGWAGDLATFKMGTLDKGAAPLQCLLLGAGFGIIAVAVLSFFDWTFNRFFILISEVLDRSGETSLLGFKFLSLLLVSLATAAACIIAGLVVALAPSSKDWNDRSRYLTFTAILSAVAVITVWGMNKHASTKYDLGKKSLAEAAGLTSSTDNIKTILLFRSGDDGPDILLQKWPMTVKYYTMADLGDQAVEVSYENLEKIQRYVDAHPNGSVFQYAAAEALYKGYHALWDISKGKEFQSKASQHLMLARMGMLARMKYLPVTAENIGYLKDFTDDQLWFVGKRGALTMAEGFYHFNMFDDAEKYLEKAREMNLEQSELNKVAIPAKPVLTKGKVYGIVTINGSPPVNAKAALFAADPLLSREKIQIFDHTINMVDVRDIVQEGRFLFESLGQGKYVLAIMTDQTTIPHDISTEKIAVNNPAGIITLDDGVANADLGRIDIVIR